MAFAVVALSVLGGLCTIFALFYLVLAPLKLRSKEAAKEVEKVKEFYGPNTLQNVGYACLMLAVLFLAADAYILSGRTGHGSGLRFALQAVSFATLVLAVVGHFGFNNAKTIAAVEILKGKDDVDLEGARKLVKVLAFLALVIFICASFIR